MINTHNIKGNEKDLLNRIDSKINCRVKTVKYKIVGKVCYLMCKELRKVRNIRKYMHILAYLDKVSVEA